ncbi:4-coumarate-CoA ligase 2 [Pochonia chlamydosporia 170]|uniref:4-coumarate-CoA ligase 2 n=1 Tax=Pochonia chlamydosporia 170 TaxID=1380566 RepID=A0A179FJG1_METCM|nr:4-coumarate-CoA ligase 2 [Pochonia chlamydosporia 170]OAQ65775.2 4-coumarate-CoA ligase 2 [Pochonia chlamydosporia 170]
MLWAGGVVCPANPTYTVTELARQLEDSNSKVLVTQKALLSVACEAARRVGIPLRNIVLIGDRQNEYKHWTEVVAHETNGPLPTKTPLDPKHDLAYLMYSSVCEINVNALNAYSQCLALGYYRSAQRCDANSLQHCVQHTPIHSNGSEEHGLGNRLSSWDSGLFVSMNMTLYAGVKCIVMPRFGLEKACQLIQKYRITFLYVPPPIILALSKDPVVGNYDTATLRWINSAAAPLGKELVSAVWDRLNIGVKQSYGLSETSPGALSQLPDEWRRFEGSVGRLIPNMTAKIVDLEGNEVPRGKVSITKILWLLCRPNVFQGYWKRPDLNSDTFTEDGWFKTGDIGYGFQVAPAELESKLLGHNDVADVCVIGVWDSERHTEVPRAYIVVRDNVLESAQLASNICEWLAKRVSPPKRLRGGVRFIKAIPKSQAGKILRRVLREEAKKEGQSSVSKL